MKRLKAEIGVELNNAKAKIAEARNIKNPKQRKAAIKAIRENWKKLKATLKGYKDKAKAKQKAAKDQIKKRKEEVKAKQKALKVEMERVKGIKTIKQKTFDEHTCSEECNHENE